MPPSDTSSVEPSRLTATPLPKDSTPCVRVNDAAHDASQAAAEESSHSAAENAAQRPSHALATANHAHAALFFAQHHRHAHVRRAA
jgi:hypothetical protein